jgi:hypothetical protein
MKSNKWILLTAVLALAGGVANVLINMRLDIYGLFRDTHGRHLGVIDNERRTKFLLSERYVPENFDSVLIGSSVSNNWNTGTIQNFHVYNESIDGGNISEEKLLVEKVLRKRALKLAICVVHPFMTDTHGINSGDMTDKEYWGALGSTTLFRAYAKLLRSRGSALLWDQYGTEEYDGPVKLNSVLRKMFEPGSDFHIDPDALMDYRCLISELRKQGTRLVVVVPPTSEELLEPKQEALARYLEQVLPLFSPQDEAIDFNAREYDSFLRDNQNFRDGIHLSRQGAAKVVAILDQHLQRSSSVVLSTVESLSVGLKTQTFRSTE